MPGWILPIGARPDESGTRFRVWAANAHRVAVVCYQDDGTETTHDLNAEGDGYFSAHIAGVAAGTRYMYRVDGGDPRPDPASRYQPESVHTFSCVVDPDAFAWSDAAWHGLPLHELVIYEIHVGTATEAGTFDSVIEKLDYYQALGVTAIEIMPVADFPGDRNWGYDGVCLFAPARTYGGSEGLRRLVDAAHARGLAVLLDVVYNHLGPDGNYLRQFSTDYFTNRHNTPWGDAVNLDGPNSGPVRDFFINNACHWAHEYHIDGLRLDATHALHDKSTPHFLSELATRVRESLPPERHFVIIAENECNDPQLVRTVSAGGMGLDGVWADDFHHQVRVAVAGDNDGYYIDYSGSINDIATTLQQGWFYTGQHSQFLNHPRGAPASDVAMPRFVHCIQNHDQVGNRALGERINHQVDLQTYRAVSALLLLTPYTPLLFMGQEWAASTPFLYFTDHNEELGRLVTEGRRGEFASFTAFSGTEVPDPQALDTFLRSKLRWDECDDDPHSGVLALYRTLLNLRKQHPALREQSREHFSVVPVDSQTLILRRSAGTPETTLLAIIHLGNTPVQIALQVHEETIAPAGYCWSVLFDSESAEYSDSNEIGPFLTGCSPSFDLLDLASPRAVLLEAVVQ